jgi:flagellar hook-basal body complex protein FliE
MISSVLATTELTGTAPSPAAKPEAQAAGSFADALTRLVETVDSNTEQANLSVGRMLDKSGDVHDAMIALQRAEMSLQLTVQIRNKLVQAYQEIMRMPV